MLPLPDGIEMILVSRLELLNVLDEIDAGALPPTDLQQDSRVPLLGDSSCARTATAMPTLHELSASERFWERSHAVHSGGN